MGCVCCMSEGEQTREILKKFPMKGVSELEEGQVTKAIGYSLSYSDDLLMHPVDGNPVVWYTFSITECCEWEEQTKDAEGKMRNQRRSSSKQVFYVERGTQFYIVDGKSSALVDCRVADQSKMSVRNNESRSGWPVIHRHAASDVQDFAKSYPRKDRQNMANAVVSAGIQIASMFASPKHAAQGRMNERYSYRYNISFVPAKDKLSVVGYCERREGKLCLSAVMTSHLNQDYFKKHEWNSKMQKIWTTITKSGAIFISNTDEDIAACQIEDARLPQPEWKSPRAAGPAPGMAPQQPAYQPQPQAMPAPQQPVYQQPGQPVYQQPYQQQRGPPPGQYQQPQPQYQQPQPQYQQPAPQATQGQYPPNNQYQQQPPPNNVQYQHPQAQYQQPPQGQYQQPPPGQYQQQPHYQQPPPGQYQQPPPQGHYQQQPPPQGQQPYYQQQPGAIVQNGQPPQGVQPVVVQGAVVQQAPNE
mmetsp:Transcript_1807/g.3252  ORF Transcript_1807/g.3252 Transcript_1807/m.3252 type:complete len:471 (-) Transcript_1807:433-1845(-)|eukprot:CAMPEP_0197515790 /NCGR_PEP_ID=MMETSP1318-20131121/806_1 /TAXON_ID=552666 /ORGANISM="Partenskyella glossopodia, Strain RCC365" /LENGTH=470 /DNA_ID=CAMNT_0043064251 /DNA_START=78 /DNA_END=1490 /DNA_ORIENTATION=-